MLASDWLVTDGRPLASGEADIDRHDGNEKRGEKMTGCGWHVTGDDKSRDRGVTEADQCHADTDILLASPVINIENTNLLMADREGYILDEQA